MSSRWLDRGGTAQVGGAPLSHKAFDNIDTAFFFDRTSVRSRHCSKIYLRCPEIFLWEYFLYPLLNQRAQRKKLSKKESGQAHIVQLYFNSLLRRPEIFLSEYFPKKDGDQRTRVGSAVAF